MGRKPEPIVWNGHRYPTLGWAIGDALQLYPSMSDPDLAALFNVDVSRVQYWRANAGIPEYRKRRGAYACRGDRASSHRGRQGSKS